MFRVLIVLRVFSIWLVWCMSIDFVSLIFRYCGVRLVLSSMVVILVVMFCWWNLRVERLMVMGIGVRFLLC